MSKVVYTIPRTRIEGRTNLCRCQISLNFVKWSMKECIFFRKISSLTSLVTRHPRLNYSSILRTHKRVGIHRAQKKRRTNGTSVRTDPRYILVLLRVHTGHSFNCVCVNVCIYYVFERKCTLSASKQRICLPACTHPKNFKARRGNGRAMTMALWKSTGIEVRLLQRGKNVAHPPRARVIKLSWKFCLPCRSAIFK